MRCEIQTWAAHHVTAIYLQFGAGDRNGRTRGVAGVRVEMSGVTRVSQEMPTKAHRNQQCKVGLYEIKQF